MAEIVSVVGKKGAGKSEVLEQLIARLSNKKLRVGVLKRLRRDDFEIDEPGKDTYRYRMNGAERVILAGRKRLALFSNLEQEISLEDLVAFFYGFDLVFAEGYLQAEFPKIEVHKKEFGDLLLTEQVTNVIAVCSDGEGRFDAPCFSFEQLDQLADFVEEWLTKKTAEVFRA